MRESYDPAKLELRAALEVQVKEFLDRGGKPTELPFGVRPIDLTQKTQQQQQRMKFTRRDDVSIGFKPADRPSQKHQEMTIMSTKPQAATAAKPKPAAVASKPAAAPKADTPKRTVPTAPSFDISALVLEKDVPMPASTRTSSSAWVPVLLKMEVGDSYFIPGKKAANLSYVKKIGEREGTPIALFTVHEKNGNGEVVEGVRLFRVATEAEASADEAGDGDDSGLDE